MPHPISDERWLDEYAKRRFLTNIWGAMSQSYMWGTGLAAAQLAVKKANGEDITLHPWKTPAAILGLMALGGTLSLFTQDQYTRVERMEKQRLSRRIAAGDDAASEISQAAAPPSSGKRDRMRWRDVAHPTWAGGKLDGEDPALEKEWYRRFFTNRMVRSFVGATQFSTFVAALTFGTRKLLDLAADENTSLNIYRTPLILTSMLGIGSVMLYRMAHHHAKEDVLGDNYLAHLVTREKDATEPATPAERALAVNLGEPIRGADAETNRITRETGAWMQTYHHKEFGRILSGSLGQQLFLGMFTVFSAMALDKAAGEEIKFDWLRSPAAITALMVVGSVATYLSCHKESECVKMKDDRLGKYLENTIGLRPAAKPEEPQETGTGESHFWRNRVLSSIHARQPVHALAA